MLHALLALVTHRRLFGDEQKHAIIVSSFIQYAASYPQRDVRIDSLSINFNQFHAQAGLVAIL